MVDALTVFAQSQPTKDAVIFDDLVLDFATFEARANQIAHVLVDAGVRPGEKMIWCGQNSDTVVAIVHASRKTGAVAVPLNYRLTPEEASYVIDNSDAAIVLFDIEQESQLGAARPNCPKVRRWFSFRDGGAAPSWAESLDSIAAGAPTDPAEPAGQPSEDAGATIIYTSGTTGKPKGALRRAADPRASVALIQLIGYQPDDIYLTTGPLYHSGPLGFMAIVQAFGGTVVVQRHFEAEAWLALVDQHRVTTTFSAPTPIRRVVDLPEEVLSKYDYSSMRRMVANAAPWPFSLKQKYAERLGVDSLWEVYGSTELGVNTVLAPEDQMRKPGSCGKAAPGVEIALFDDDGNQVTEVGKPGELFVRSSGTFDTYYKAQEKFDASTRGDWITVGDIAYRDDEDFYFICDRKNDMIISGGMNIYPAEIEAALVAHPAVADAAVFGVPSDEWGEGVHAVITVYEDAAVTDEELMAYARDHLAGYKVPRSFDRMAEIPRSASGKILKKELRAPYWDNAT